MEKELGMEGEETQGGDLDAAVVAALANGDTYEQIAARHERSVGWVYRVAVRLGARKHELKISERALVRKRRQAEFLKAVIGATETSDCLDYLEGVPSKSVKLHVTSPPYNIGRGYGEGYGDRASFTFYLGWLLQVCAELERTLEDGGVLFLQVGSTYGREGHAPWPIDSILFGHLVGLGLVFQSRVTWVIPHGLTPRSRLSERAETALVFSKGPIKTFNAMVARTPTKEPGKRFFKGPRKNEISSHWAGSWPSNVWTLRNVAHNSAEKAGHVAQFPEALARRAVMLYSNPGELVMDVFSGSGTVEAVCKMTGREFAGCDLFYGEMRRERLAKVSPDLVSLLQGVTDQSVAVWQAEARPVRVAAEPVSEAALEAVRGQMVIDLQGAGLEPLMEAA